jgi:DNA-binding IclR family transcriptional regulator
MTRGIPGIPVEMAPTVGAVDKAMLVLAALITNGRPTRLCDLTRLTGLPKATVHRLVNILRRHRMLDLRDDKYVLGERLTGAAGWNDDDYRQMLRRESTPYLVELHKSTGLSASVGVLSGNEVVYANRIFGHQFVRTSSYYSDRISAQCSAIGEVLRAGSLSRAVDTDGTVQDAADLLRVWHSGVAQSSRRHPHGLICIAALVRAGFGGHAPTAMVLSGVPADTKVPAISVLLRNTAYRLSRSITHATSNPPR